MSKRNYYYFVATLPSITYGDKPPVSSLEFFDECHYLLHPDDAALIPFCTYDPRIVFETLESTGNEFVDYLLSRERVLIVTLAALRSAKLSFPLPQEQLNEASSRYMPRTEAVAKAAFEMNDPLEAELFLDKSRWEFLDDKVGIDDMFGVNNIFVYMLKLKLLERRQRFDAARGFTAYREQYDTILNEYNAKHNKKDAL